MSLYIDDTSNREKLSNETIDQLFSQLKAEDIEQFYMAYQLWSQRKQVEQLQLQMLSLQQKIAENAAQMAQFQPSAIALASLAQLQACGVEDTDLLDRMLERGEEWLDHSIQLLERCEQLDLIGGNYTQWCTHALEGAYDWLDSITSEIVDPGTHEKTITDETQVTEEQLLKKLMSEEGEDEKQAPEKQTRITQPLTLIDEQDGIGDETKKVTAIKPLKRITQPLPAIDESIITDEQAEGEEDTQQFAAIKLPRPITQPLPTTDEPAISDEQVTMSSSVQGETEIEQSLTLPDSIATTEINQVEPVGTESETIATQVDMTEVSDQEPLHTNIEENEINNTLNSAEQELPHASAPLPLAYEVQDDKTVVIERIDQNKSGNDTEDRSDGEEQQEVRLQDLPASKKKASKRKKGFLRWLLAKFLRR